MSTRSSAVAGVPARSFMRPSWHRGPSDVPVVSDMSANGGRLARMGETIRADAALLDAVRTGDGATLHTAVGAEVSWAALHLLAEHAFVGAFTGSVPEVDRAIERTLDYRHEATQRCSRWESQPEHWEALRLARTGRGRARVGTAPWLL